MSSSQKKIVTGLFFGSFNPIHIGHLAIANYMSSFGNLDELWFVVSPQNPLKQKSQLLADHYRLEMVRMALGDYDGFRVSDIEFKLPKPSFTIDTLAYLSEKHPKREFVLIVGGDNIATFNKWKNYKTLLNNYKLLVYSRPGWDGGEYAKHPNVTSLEAPQMEISSSFIRKSIKEKKDIRFFLPNKVWEYIYDMHFYKK